MDEITKKRYLDLLKPALFDPTPRRCPLCGREGLEIYDEVEKTETCCLCGLVACPICWQNKGGLRQDEEWCCPTCWETVPENRRYKD